MVKQHKNCNSIDHAVAATQWLTITLFGFGLLTSALWVAGTIYINHLSMDGLQILSAKLPDVQAFYLSKLIDIRIDQSHDRLKYEVYCYYVIIPYVLLLISITCATWFAGSDLDKTSKSNFSVIRRRRIITFSTLLLVFFVAPFYLTHSFLFKNEASSLISLMISDLSLAWAQSILAGALFTAVKGDGHE